MGSSGVLCGPLKASWLWLSQVGDEGAGHFVKMVHNGIEYGDMQLICEAYHLMKDVLAMGHAEMAKVSLGRGGAGVLRARSCLTLRPHGLKPARLLCPWGFSRQEYWSGLPLPSPGDLPDPGV